MSLRVIFMGMEGEFSAIPLERLMAAGVEVCAVVLPAMADGPAPAIRALAPPRRPAANLLVQTRAVQRNLTRIAWDERIPLYEVSRLRDPQALAALAAFNPDAILVACFPYILPQRLLDVPRHGCFNLHPSLLPALRGPAPLFWTFHEGCAPGVTVHRMSARADSGEIAAQRALVFPDGLGYGEAERLCARAGADLLVEVCRALEHGDLNLRPQDERQASAFPYPAREDFVVTPAWTVRRAFNFIRGVADFGGPVTI
ncbi:MAG: hypothetical protein HYR71_10060, partial [Chloroflexi bacterium]|nr:hypothetical protein [Chloroflexota bacterium]